MVVFDWVSGFFMGDDLSGPGVLCAYSPSFLPVDDSNCMRSASVYLAVPPGIFMDGVSSPFLRHIFTQDKETSYRLATASGEK